MLSPLEATDVFTAAGVLLAERSVISATVWANEFMYYTNAAIWT